MLTRNIMFALALSVAAPVAAIAQCTQGDTMYRQGGTFWGEFFGYNPYHVEVCYCHGTGAGGTVWVGCHTAAM